MINTVTEGILVGASLGDPHINVKFVRSVCLSSCPYVHDTKIYKINTNLRGTFVCGFGALFCAPTFNKHVVTNNMNKQVLILRSKLTDR